MDPAAGNQQIPSPESTPQQPIPTSASTSPLKQIRTFEGDVAEEIAREHESVLSIAKAENSRKDAIRFLGPKEVEAPSYKALIYSILTLVLLLVGGLGAWYTYKTYTTKIAAPVIAPPLNELTSAEPIINVDASTLSRDTLLASINTEKGKTLALNNIEQIELRRGPLPTSDLLTTTDFLTRLATHAPEALVRAFNPLFMLGLLGGTPSHAFMLVKLDSFENAFPGMLNWEPSLATDLLPVFASEAVAASVASGAEWQDITLLNRDARILKDSTGHTVMLYAFFDDKILLVTDNEASFLTLVGRLQSEKLSR